MATVTTVLALLDDAPEQYAALAIAQQTAEHPTTADAAGLLAELAR